MDREAFLKLVTDDRESHISLLQRFVQASSPNPPGDIAGAAQVLIDYLADHGVDVEIIAPQGMERPNLVSEFSCGPDVEGGGSASS